MMKGDFFESVIWLKDSYNRTRIPTGAGLLLRRNEGDMERPILFSTPMVRAILEGRKTMTRRVVKNKELLGLSEVGFDDEYIKLPEMLWDERCSYGKPGDILWVRETWANTWTPDGITGFVYKADGDPQSFPYWGDEKNCKDGVWKPSIFMPRAACRIRLRITDIRVERLQDITEEDAKAEGIKSYWAEPHRDVAPFIGAAKEIGEDLCHTRKEAFQQLWDHLNKERGHGWNKNPWVWVISFERVHP